MKRKVRRVKLEDAASYCVLCRLPDDDPALFGEKVFLKEHNMSVHYFCLLTSCGIYQRGEDDEGVFGFLVNDIKHEVQRSSRLTCLGCNKKGACVGCCVKNCRRKVHFPCGRKLSFISQFTGLFPSYCPAHSPSQSISVTSDLSLPQTCSVCLDSLDPVLSFSVLKCPSCHASWFHRDCVQRQAHSAGLFFFKCTLCNSKEKYQEEMLRMGIYIPERDASWELEANAYSELLEVYSHCDAEECLCNSGRTHSAKTGWFEVIRCRLCGSRGTHRKCSGLKVHTADWACSECTMATDGRASLVASPQAGQRRSLLSKRHLPSIHSSITCKRPPLHDNPGSPEQLLQALIPPPRPQGSPAKFHLEVIEDQVLIAALDMVRNPNFDPSLPFSVRFKDTSPTLPVRTQRHKDEPLQEFLILLVQQIQDSVVFEGPSGCKNLALDSQALREDLYFDLGCLLAMALVLGPPGLSFFSPGLYQCLFNFPPNHPLDITHMTPDSHLARQVTRIAEAASLDQLKEAAAASWEFLEVAGCNQPISSLEERDPLVENLVCFTLIGRMQMPLQRFREGLRTLGVFEQVQLFPSMFYSTFCETSLQLSARALSRIFTISLSQQEKLKRKEEPVIGFWRRFLFDCEAGRSSISLEDLIHFSTGKEDLPAIGLDLHPSISFLHPLTFGPVEKEGKWGGEEGEVGLFPQSQPASSLLLLPVTSTYQAFKGSMEQAISHYMHAMHTDT